MLIRRANVFAGENCWVAGNAFLTDTAEFFEDVTGRTLIEHVRAMEFWMIAPDCIDQRRIFFAVETVDQAAIGLR